VVSDFGEGGGHSSRDSGHLCSGLIDYHRLGGDRSNVQLQRYLAAHHKHRHYHHHVFNGVPDPEHANRDTQALQLKLDELIRVTKGAHNLLIDLEELDDEQLEQLRRTYERLGKMAREKPKSD
jgi:hypothetical protein